MREITIHPDNTPDKRNENFNADSQSQIMTDRTDEKSEKMLENDFAYLSEEDVNHVVKLFDQNKIKVKHVFDFKFPDLSKLKEYQGELTRSKRV